MSGRRILMALLLGCAVLASMVTPLASEAVAQPGPISAGSDAASSVAAPPDSGPQPGDPTAAADQYAAAEVPPEGSQQRRMLDDITARTQDETDQLQAREQLTAVTPEAAPATAEVVVEQPADAGPTVGSGPEQLDAQAEAGANPCAEIGNQPWFVRWSDGGIVVSPTATAAGRARLTLVNDGSQSWPTNATHVVYRLFDNSGAEIGGTYPRTTLGAAVGPGGSRTVEATIAALRPGTYRVSWDVLVDGAGRFTDLGNCDYKVEYTIQNQPPSLILQSPPTFGTVLTRTPTLFVNRSDPDGYPDVSVSVEFRVCRDAAMTVSCIGSGFSTLGAYTLPANYVGWNDRFWWTARVSDGQAETPPSGYPPPNQVTVVVPAPDIWRAVGAGRGLVNHFGVVLPYGIWIHEEVDAEVAGYGQPLSIERTYSSGADGVTGAFGLGWLSVFDASAQFSPDGQQLTITYPDGRQEIFARQGAGWVTRLDSGVTNRLTIGGDGVITVRTSGQEVVRYGPAGELRAVETTGVGALRMVRNTRGQIGSIVQEPSGRALIVGWSSDAGATCASTAAVICSIMAEDPKAGQFPLVWSYSYRGARMARMCDPGNRCTSYDNADGAFAVSPAGRRTWKPYVSVWGPVYGDPSWEYNSIGVLAAGERHRIVLHRARPGRLPDYLREINEYGGIAATVYFRESDGSPIRPTTAAQIDTYRFDELNRLRALTHGPVDVLPRGSNSRLWSYDLAGPDIGRLGSFIDENFHVMAFTYDAYGNPTGQSVLRDANSQITVSSSYRPVDGDPNSTRMQSAHRTPLQSTLPRNYEMFGYDTQGRLTRRTGAFTAEAPAGASTFYTYTTGSEVAVGPRRGGTGTATTVPAGLPRTVVTPAGTTRFEYNVQGDLTGVINPVGRRIAYDYDDLGRRTSETEYSDTFPAGVRTDFVLDRSGQVVEEIFPQTRNEVTGVLTRKRICREYERDGLPSKVVETGSLCPAPGAHRRAGDRTTDWSYDLAGRLSTVFDAAAGLTRYNYSFGGYDSGYDQQVTVVDPLGRTRSSFFDNGLLARETSSIGTSGVATWEYSYDPAGRRWRQVDPVGRETWFDWSLDDINYKTVRILGPAPGQPGYFHYSTIFERTADGAGRITSDTTGDRRQRIETVYDGDGKLVDSILDPAGLNRRLHRDYDPAGRVLREVLTGLGGPRETRYTYDAAGGVLDTIVENGPEDLISRVTRDQRGLPVTITDPRGATAGEPAFTTRIRHDELGRRVLVTGAPVTVEAEGVAPRTEQPAVAVGYNVFGDVTHVRDERGLVTETIYDDVGRVTEIRGPPYTAPGTTTPRVPTTLRSYNIVGDVIAETDARGNTTNYDYDRAGNLITVTGPDMGAGRPVTRTEYDAAGQVTATVDPGGARTSFEYDLFGNRTAVTEHVRQPAAQTLFHTTRYSYDRSGNVTEIRSPNGHVSSARYNAANELVAVRSPGVNGDTTFTRNLAGQVTRVKDPAGRLTLSGYDQAGRQTVQSHNAPSGALLDESSVQYDRAGNVIATVDARGTRSTFGVDALGRTVSANQPVTPTRSIATTAGYDIAGNLVRQTDGNGNSTWATYNTLGLLERLTEPATPAHPLVGDRQWVTTYDLGGLPVREDKPGGVPIVRTFDAFGRLTSENSTSASAGPATRNLRYDISGRLAAAVHPSGGEQTFTYSDRGLLLGSTGPSGGSSYVYNVDGRLTSRTDAAGTANFSWRADGQLAVATDPLTNQLHAFGYDPNSGELTSVNRSGNVTSFARDDRGLISAITTRNAGGGALFDASYSYDANGNVTRKQINTGSPSGGRYTYDLADRLTSWAPQGSNHTWAYGWDDAGNRTSEQLLAEAAFQTDFAYDARNRLTTATFSDDLGPAPPTNYTYSARGTLARTASGSTTEITSFDGFDRLTADNRRGAVGYEYDSLDRLSTRFHSVNGTPTSTSFSYAGLDPDPTGVGADRFSREPDGDVLATRRDGVAKFMVTDARGDVVNSYTPQGVGGDGALFTPFGQSQYGFHRNGVGFQGDWTDPTTHRVFMHARWYDPDTATFLSRDSIDSGNRYSYADANPLRFTDPTGHCPAEIDADGDRRGRTGTSKPTSAKLGSRTPTPRLGWAGKVLGGAFIPVLEMLAEHNQNQPQCHRYTTLEDRKPLARDQGSMNDGRTPRPPAPPRLVHSSSQSLARTTMTTSSYSAPGVEYHRADTHTDYYDRQRRIWSNGARYDSGERLVGWTHVTNEQVTYEWSEVSHGYGQGYRYTRTDDYRNTYARQQVSGSAGYYRNSGWQQVAWWHGWQVDYVLTVDPHRVDAYADGGINEDAGLLEVSQADDGGGASCGLSGGLVSCLAEVSVSPVGGGCAGVTATMQACVPAEPQPANPGGQREALDTDSASCVTNSFTPDTLVLMADGSHKPIGQVREGDFVRAKDPVTGDAGPRRVTRQITGQGVKDLVEITVEVDGPAGRATDIVTATDGHPFWVDDHGRWIDAGDLTSGNLLRASAGTVVQVTAVDRKKRPQRVHNLTVDGIPAYYVVVGDGSALVHNASGCGSEIPFGFSGSDDFAGFGNDLRSGLGAAGYDDVAALIQGSAVTGRSFRTGAPFDIGRTSDFDVALASPQLLARAAELGIGLRSGGIRTGPLGISDLESLGLGKIAGDLTTRSGREVNFMVYGSIDDAIARSGGIRVP